MRNDLQFFMNELNSIFYQESYKSFPIDVLETNEGYQVIAEIPGVNKENIEISFEDETLTILVNKEKTNDQKYLLHERSNSKMKRAIYFKDIQEESLSAKYENGLLNITIKVKVPEIKEKKSIVIE